MVQALHVNEELVPLVPGCLRTLTIDEKIAALNKIVRKNDPITTREIFTGATISAILGLKRVAAKFAQFLERGY